jgi:hypothetical protein
LTRDFCRPFLLEALFSIQAGPRGGSRDIAEPDLVAALAAGFKIPENRILSEYGMSELASAAYTPPGSPRRLKFQNGVVPFVVTGFHDDDMRCLQGEPAGTGLLGIFDLNRIDIPAPVVTEDVVQLAEDGSFKLIGRATTAPLKGCSLLAEGKNRGSTHVRPRLTFDTDRRDQGKVVDSALKAVEVFVSGESAEQALTAAMGSQKAAGLALADLKARSQKLLETATPGGVASTLHW